MKTKILSKRLQLVLAVLVMVMAAVATARPVAAGNALECSEQSLTVKLTPDATETYQVRGTLCSQGSAAGKTVQLLLHGATYARYYWDLPFQPEHYSYVRAATKRGYVTFNLDRIGNGASDHPDGNLVDMNSNAYVIHQVVEALRAGQVASQSFEKVIIVAHSMGSFVTINYAGSYPGEADGIILTGYLHDVNMDFVNASLLPALYPATLDPKFAGRFPNYDYLTTLPGTRGGPFYYLPNTNPQVLALDENLKQITTVGEMSTGPGMIFDPISLQIEGPVQVVIGEFDHIFCGHLLNCSHPAEVQSYEQAFYGDPACVEVDVIKDSGHDLNFHTNSDAAFNQMLSWADRNVGTTPGAAPQPCGQ